jgi:hypothetical protein
MERRLIHQSGLTKSPDPAAVGACRAAVAVHGFWSGVAQRVSVGDGSPQQPAKLKRAKARLPTGRSLADKSEVALGCIFQL